MAARQGLAAAVIIQPAAAQAGVVQRPELVQKRCRQCRAGTGGGGRIKQRTRHRGKLLGPAAGRLNQVETKPQHGIIQHAGFQVYGGFGQNTADLFAVLPQVVHPFDLDGRAAQLLRCTGSGNCGQCGDLRGLAGAECRPQQNAQVQPARWGEQGPEGIMVESMLIGMAEYYSAELALKVARGERENALQCKYNGGVVPLGFTIGKEDRLYHIDPETAPIVQEIFSRYANGEPAEKIAASLNERGLRTRTGKPFVKNSFFQIFRNRRYIGEYRYKDIVTPGGIPAIVDEDLFDRVQQRFEQNRIAHGRPAKEDVSYLLTTKLFCGKCGTLMGGESGTSHMGNTYYYYKCGNAKRHGKAHCDLKAIRKEPLERFVVDTAIKVIFSDEIIERLIDLVMEAQQQENTRLPVLKEQLRDTEKRLANLLEAIEQGILTSTTKQRLDELEARKEALNTSILEEELKKPVLTREWIRFWLEKFRKGDVGSTEHQRQIIDTFVNSVYVFDDRVVLNFNFTDDAKTVTREEVLGSSAVDNAPPNIRPFT